MKQERITEDEVGAMLEEAFEGEPFKRIEPPPRFSVFFRPMAEPESFLDRLKRFLVIPSVPRRLVFSGAAAAILLVVLIPLMPGDGQPTYRDALTSKTAELPSGRLDAAPGALQWPGVAGAVTYQVELTDAEGNLLWSAEASSNRIDLPDRLLEDQPVGSEYSVRVIGYGPDRSVAGQQRSRFMVLP